MLKDILIVDLADEQGSFCSRLLACLGATVLKIGAPGPKDPRAPGALHFFYSNTNKLEAALDLQTTEGRKSLRELILRADALVETFGLGGIEAVGLGRQTLRRLNPGLVHLSITPFGRTGPRRGYQSSDAVAAAFGGWLYVNGRRGGPPAGLYGRQSYYAAALFGAVTLLMHLRQREVTGKGTYIDLSIQEAVASTLGHVPVDYHSSGAVARRGENSDFVTLPAADGCIQMTVLRDWETLLQLMQSDGKARELSPTDAPDAAGSEDCRNRILAAIRGWTCGYPKRRLFELGQAMRFPWASVDPVDAVLQNPQLRERAFFVRTPLSEGGPPVSVPRLPFKCSSYEPVPIEPLKRGVLISALLQKYAVRRHEEGGSGSPRVLRVLDLTRMLSGPYATRILADSGALVLKVQSLKTARGAEQNDTVQFSAWNRNKRSVTLDLDEPRAREIFLKLVAGSDILVENYSPRVMANWGLSYERLRQVNPSLVMVSISAMGQTGPWRDFVGFAPTFHALSGLIAASFGDNAQDAAVGCPYADVVAGLYAALAALAAVRRRGRTGLGEHIDLSALEAMCTLLGPAYLERQIGLSPGESEIGLETSRVFQCAGDDRWCVASVKHESQWAEVSALIGAEAASQSAEVVVERLQKAGIAAGVVQNAADLARDEQLKARRFFVTPRHPILGKVVSDRSALWDWRVRTNKWRASPLLGEDNHLIEEEPDPWRTMENCGNRPAPSDLRDRND